MYVQIELLWNIGAHAATAAGPRPTHRTYLPAVSVHYIYNKFCYLAVRIISLRQDKSLSISIKYFEVGRCVRGRSSSGRGRLYNLKITCDVCPESITSKNPVGQVKQTRELISVTIYYLRCYGRRDIAARRVPATPHARTLRAAYNLQLNYESNLLYLNHTPITCPKVTLNL